MSCNSCDPRVRTSFLFGVAFTCVATASLFLFPTHPHLSWSRHCQPPASFSLSNRTSLPLPPPGFGGTATQPLPPRGTAIAVSMGHSPSSHCLFPGYPWTTLRPLCLPFLFSLPHTRPHARTHTHTGTHGALAFSLSVPAVYLWGLGLRFLVCLRGFFALFTAVGARSLARSPALLPRTFISIRCFFSV